MLHHLKDKLHDKVHGFHELITCTTSHVVELSDQVIQQLENDAEVALHAMTEHLQQMSDDGIPLKEANAIARKVVTGIDKVLVYLEFVTDTHPMAKLVVSSIRTVVDFEKARQENTVLIARIHASMINAAFHMRVLAPLMGERDVLSHTMNSVLQAMAVTIKEFGAFVDLYNRNRQKIFKFLMAQLHNKQLDQFSGNFEKYRSQLHDICMTRATVMTQRKLNAAQEQLETVIKNTRDIKESLQDLLGEDAETIAAVETYVTVNGGFEHVIQDDHLLDHVGELLGENVSHRVKTSLRHNYEDLLKEHAERYEMKLQAVEGNMIHAIKTSSSELSRQIKEGPHELIDDADIKEIWRSNGWKSSVKCRVFIEGLREYYQYKICKKSDSIENLQDAWTVDFFARMMYHSAISDLVDEDGSGFVTATEVNTFCSTKGRRPPQWTTPQWLAFCASGWYNNNAWYYSRIKNMLKQIDAEVQKVKSSEPGWNHLQTIVASLKPLLFIEDVDGDEELQDERKDAVHHLLRLQEDYRSSELKWIQPNLEKLQYHLDDKAAVTAAMGDHRIELHIMCILYLFVEHMLKEITEHGNIHNVEDVAESCMVSYLAFEDRIHELMRGWRSQGRDVNLQLARYADGLFRNIEREAPKRKMAMETLCTLLFGTRSTNAARYSNMIRAASRHSPHSQLSDLVARMGDVVSTQDELVHQMSQVVSEQASLASQVADLSKKMDRIEQLLLGRPPFDVAHSFADRNPHFMGHSRGSA
ncbi:hypothetical protein BD310DRAFT_920986 [Dichomitus squalens]|uniref:EF-hand domain-containing protein n=1 Tax=Dichomitus squalens TaxID=114155 RepID=A0A4Q9Q2G2_9APHY|nr:hypothetical protein BD310DRAFT_920986 [Dichomitus squalens]